MDDDLSPGFCPCLYVSTSGWSSGPAVASAVLSSSPDSSSNAVVGRSVRSLPAGWSSIIIINYLSIDTHAHRLPCPVSSVRRWLIYARVCVCQSWVIN